MPKLPTVKIWDIRSQMNFSVGNAAHTSSSLDAGAKENILSVTAQGEGWWKLATVFIGLGFPTLNLC